VYGCGSNGQGELGNGDFNSRFEIDRIASLNGKDIKRIACGSYSMALTYRG